METLNSNQTIRQVITLLKLTFGIVPIVAGLDKFTNILTQWENYLHLVFPGYYLLSRIF